MVVGIVVGAVVLLCMAFMGTIAVIGLRRMRNNPDFRRTKGMDWSAPSGKKSNKKR